MSGLKRRRDLDSDGEDEFKLVNQQVPRRRLRRGRAKAEVSEEELEEDSDKPLVPMRKGKEEAREDKLDDSDSDKPLLSTRKGKAKASEDDLDDSDSDKALLPTKTVGASKVPSSTASGPSRGRGRAKAAKQSAIAGTQGFDTSAATVTYAVSDDEINTNPIHSSVRKVKLWLENALRIKKYAPTNAPAAMRASVREWSKLSSISGRVHALKTITKTSGGYWQVFILNKSTDNLFFTGDKKVVSIADHLIIGDDDLQMRNRCNTIGRQLCFLFDRCPIPYPTGSGGTALVRMLIRLAIEIAYPQEKPRAVWPTITQRAGTGTAYSIAVWFVDSNTNELGSYGVPVQPSTFIGVHPDKIPDVAESHQFFVGGNHKPIDMDVDDNGKLVLPRLVPEDKNLKGVKDRMAHDTATKFICWLSTVLQDTVTTKDDIQRFASASRRMFGAKTPSVHGIYGGYPLFLVSYKRSARNLELRPSAQLRANFAGLEKVPTIYIRGTLAAADAATALEAGIDAFVNEGDERLAILAAAQEADRVSQHRGFFSHVRCECTENMALTQGHCCHRCLLFVPCHTRKFSVISACWLCETCMARDKSSVNKYSDMIEQLLQISLRRSTKEECRLNDIDFDSEEFQDQVYLPALKEVCANNKSTSGNLVYFDDYSGQHVQFGLGSLSALPQTPSVDAVFPKFRVVRDGEQAYYKHISGNLAVTDSATNRFKHVNFPGFLAYTSDFVNGKITTQEYLEACNELTKVRCKIPYLTTDLQKLPEIDDDQWSSDLAEMVACSTAAATDSTKSVPLRVFAQNHTSFFNQGDREDLTNIYNEICEKSVAPAVFGKDGCPWILGAEDAPMPQGWCWEWCFNLFHERLLRMKGTCNRKWKTFESEKSLFCEVVYQRHTPNDIVCRELLGLPLSVYLRHPLRFSIAHRHHGFQMRTGWSLDPKSLDDRDESLNNVLIEAWVTNSMKLDLEEKYYHFLKGIVAAYKVPKRFFDPTKASEINPDHSAASEAYVQEDYDADDMVFLPGDDIEDSVTDKLIYADEHAAADDDDK